MTIVYFDVLCKVLGGLYYKVKVFTIRHPKIFVKYYTRSMIKQYEHYVSFVTQIKLNIQGNNQIYKKHLSDSSRRHHGMLHNFLTTTFELVRQKVFVIP